MRKRNQNLSSLGISENKTMKYIKNTMLIIVLIIILILLTFLTLATITTVKTPTVKDSIAYNETGNLSYNVCLKENEFITDNKCQPEGKSFITSLIDNINLNVNYTMSSSKLANYTYTYKVVATTTANEKGEASKVLYTKSSDLKNEKKELKNTNFVVIKDTISIDYQKYNEIIKEFKRNYVLSLDSNLVIKVYITLNGKSENINKPIKKNHTMQITVPLSEQTVNITKTDTSVNDINVIKEVEKSSGEYTSFDLFIDILYKVDIIYILIVICILIKLFPQERKYTKLVKKILKNYDAYIVRSKTIPPLDECKIIEVQEFKDLIDAKENLDKPIIFYESRHKSYALFTIINDKEAFVYLLYEFEEKKNGKKEKR